MNVKHVIATRFITTYLTSAIITLFRFAVLAVPIGTIYFWINSATSPVWVVFTASIFGVCIAHTIARAIARAMMLNLPQVCRVFFLTPVAFSGNAPFSIFGLPCSKFRTALGRTKTTFAIGPINELFVAPIAYIFSFLARICGCPSSLKSAFLGTKAASRIVGTKLFFADFANFICHGTCIV